jgi:thiopeptide-type bacteriocin biosynthesis protein
MTAAGPEILKDITDKGGASLDAFVARVIEHADQLGSVLSYGAAMERVIAACARELARVTEPQSWLYVRVPCAARDVREVIARVIRPLMLRRSSLGQIRAWWWIYKDDIREPHLRIRLLIRPGGDREVELDFTKELSSTASREVRMLQYEPEMGFFGGALGMALAHQVFCIDSEFLAQWFLGDSKYSALDSSVSVVLCSELLRSAGLDLHEQWDVWRQLKALRTVRGHADAVPSEQRRAWADKMTRTNGEQLLELLDSERTALLEKHLASLRLLGRGIGESAANGELEWGVRHFLTWLIVFHWNRFCFSLPVQAGIATTIALTLSPHPQ